MYVTWLVVHGSPNRRQADLASASPNTQLRLCKDVITTTRTTTMEWRSLGYFYFHDSSFNFPDWGVRCPYHV